MKNGFLIFLAAFVLLGSSWGAFVLAPVLQLGAAKQTEVLNSYDIYPIQRTGDATLGLQVYRANGCAACHTEQIQQSGVDCDVILTTGGTGLSPRDVTVEAAKEVIEREIPGVAEAARAYGQRRTSRAMLSRGVAGQRGKSVIVTLPGSTKAVEEWMAALFPGLLHAFDVMRSRPGH